MLTRLQCAIPTRRSSDLPGAADLAQAGGKDTVIPRSGGTAAARAGAGERTEYPKAPNAMMTRMLRFILAALSAVPCLARSEEHTSELQSLRHLVCRLLLE